MPLPEHMKIGMTLVATRVKIEHLYGQIPDAYLRELAASALILWLKLLLAERLQALSAPELAAQERIVWLARPRRKELKRRRDNMGKKKNAKEVPALDPNSEGARRLLEAVKGEKPRDPPPDVVAKAQALWPKGSRRRRAKG